MFPLVLWLLVIILFTTGLVGIIIPFLPGIVLVFAGIAIYAVLTKFAVVGAAALLLFGSITFLAWLAGYAGSALGARVGGGKTPSLVGTIIGGIAGLMTVGPLGLLLGAFLGAIVGAMYEGKNHKQATKTALYAVAGIIGGTLMQLVIAICMIIAFLIIVVV